MFKNINPLRSNFKKWPNTLKRFVGNLPTNYVNVFGHFVELALKGLRRIYLRYIVLPQYRKNNY